MRVAELADKIRGSHQFAFLTVPVGSLRGKTGIFDSVCYSLGIEPLTLADPFHHEQFRSLDMVGQQRGVGSPARQLDLVAFGIDHVTILAVAAKNAAHITDV